MCHPTSSRIFAGASFAAILQKMHLDPLDDISLLKTLLEKTDKLLLTLTEELVRALTSLDLDDMEIVKDTEVI